MESLKELYEWFLEAEEEDEEEDDEEPSEATEDSSNSTLKKEDSSSPPKHSVVPLYLSSTPAEEEYVPHSLHFPPAVLKSLAKHQTEISYASDASPLPPLCCSDSESSLDDLSDESFRSSSETSSRRLSFNSKVEVREYSLTVGNHPCCEDSLPLSLDWEHADAYDKDIAESKHRDVHYKFPPRLSLEQRSLRLRSVSDLDEQTIEMVDELVEEHRRKKSHLLSQGPCVLMGLLQRSWSRLSAIRGADDEEEDEYEVDDEEEVEDEEEDEDEDDQQQAPPPSSKDDGASLLTEVGPVVYNLPAQQNYCTDPFSV